MIAAHDIPSPKVDSCVRVSAHCRTTIAKDGHILESPALVGEPRKRRPRGRVHSAARPPLLLGIQVLTVDVRVLTANAR
jgi:hypothetical protein